MTVDRIEPLDKRRCKVFLDGDFAFVLYRGELKKYHVEEGAELTEESRRLILEQVICLRARERALYLLKYSARTEAEIRRRLKDSWYPNEAVERTLTFLKEYRFLDDRGYAANYIEVYGARKSRAEITAALMKKGVDRSDIEEILQDKPPDEAQQVAALLKKRRYSGSCASPDEKKKAIAFLMRKGFSYGIIKSVIGEWGEEPDFYAE